ncbi:hypothetical protein AVEN_159003-1 [Araneus ventricosus]|uniref:Uncharacterized protein n=1 Tax=Araneus ventricosus TaxID=182803 RepID=A0A4Y2BC97_ARAVE|nr:hypothetical protein AVEN_159003-1 [Araneus ventricosus]
MMIRSFHKKYCINLSMKKKSEIDGLGRRKTHKYSNKGNETLDAKRMQLKNVKVLEFWNEDDQMILVGKGMRQKDIINNVWFDDVQFVPENSSERCIFFAL